MRYHFVIQRTQPAEKVMYMYTDPSQFLKYWFGTSVYCNWEYLGIADENDAQPYLTEEDPVAAILESNKFRMLRSEVRNEEGVDLHYRVECLWCGAHCKQYEDFINCLSCKQKCHSCDYTYTNYSNWEHECPGQPTPRPSESQAPDISV